MPVGRTRSQIKSRASELQDLDIPEAEKQRLIAEEEKSFSTEKDAKDQDMGALQTRMAESERIGSEIDVLKKKSAKQQEFSKKKSELLKDRPGRAQTLLAR